MVGTGLTYRAPNTPAYSDFALKLLPLATILGYEISLKCLDLKTCKTRLLRIATTID